MLFDSNAIQYVIFQFKEHKLCGGLIYNRKITDTGILTVFAWFFFLFYPNGSSIADIIANWSRVETNNLYAVAGYIATLCCSTFER